MRQGTTKARHVEPERDLCGPANAAVRSGRVDPLTLPVLQPSAFNEIGDPIEATFALHWLDAGYLDDTMAEQSTTSLVETGFQNWFNKLLGETPALTGMGFAYSMSGDRPAYSDVKPDRAFWSFEIDLDGVVIRLLEPKFNEIESKAPGLFLTALETYDSVMCQVGLTGTPQCVRYLAEYSLWCGIDNDEDYREELELNGMTPEDMEGLLLPSQFDDALPAWILGKPDKDGAARLLLNTKALDALAASSDPEIAKIATLVLALQQSKDAVVAARIDKPDDMEPIYPLALLRWNRDDEIGRGYDDIINRANECGDGYTTVLVAESVEHGSDAFQEWRERYEPVLAALGHANALLELISVADED